MQRTPKQAAFRPQVRVCKRVMSSIKNLVSAVVCLSAASAFAFGQVNNEMLRVVPTTQRPRFVTRLNLYIEYTLKREEEKIKAVPQAVNRHKVGPKKLIPALGHSSRGIIGLLTLSCDRGRRRMAFSV